jgi:hypothetical protein
MGPLSNRAPFIDSIAARIGSRCRSSRRVSPSRPSASGGAAPTRCTQRPLDRRLAFQLHAEFGEERFGGLEVVDNDENVVQRLNRHSVTLSTAADQVRIVGRAMRLAVFASIVATPSATLPVAGTVQNTNMLLGHNGFVGVKTGSTNAAGGCFAFRAIRWIDGKRTTITGVVLGQPGHDQIAAGLAAADTMVDSIAGHSQHQVPAMPGLQQRALPFTAATAWGGTRW